MSRITFLLFGLATLAGGVAFTASTAAFANAQGVAASAPETSKYSLKVPGGLAFSEFRGYEDWAVVAVQHTADLTKVVVGNPLAMDAFRAGIPGNGKPFPDGAKMAKLEWKPAKSPDSPYDITVPGAVYDLDFMVKDSKRFADGDGWGYAVFKHDTASGHVRARHTNAQAAAGKQCQVWHRVPLDCEGKRLRLHGVREAVIAPATGPIPSSDGGVSGHLM